MLFRSPSFARVRVKLGEIDEITLDVGGTVIERLDTPAEAPPEDDAGEDEPVAGPIAIAVDMNEADAGGGGDNPNP